MRVEHWVEHFPRRLFVKRGVFYFVRRVPKALQERFGSSGRRKAPMPRVLVLQLNLGATRQLGTLHDLLGKCSRPTYGVSGETSDADRVAITCSVLMVPFPTQMHLASRLGDRVNDRVWRNIL